MREGKEGCDVVDVGTADGNLDGRECRRRRVHIPPSVGGGVIKDPGSEAAEW